MLVPPRIPSIPDAVSTTLASLRMRSPFSSYSWSYSAAPNMRPKIGEAKSGFAQASRQPARSLAGAAQFIPPPTTAVIAPSREALRLYREILRTAKGFWWEDDYGQPFGEQLAKSARREFEDWRGERDPEVIANRIMITRHCLMDIQNQYAARAAELESQSVPGIPGYGAPAPPPSFGAASQLGLPGAGPPSPARWHDQPLQQRVENRMRRGPQTFNKSSIKDSII